MTLLVHFIRRVFSHNKGKSAKKAEPEVKPVDVTPRAGSETQQIVEGSIIPFVLEDVTLPFTSEIKELEALPSANKGLLKLANRIESGTFGEVWSGYWKQGELETKVAIKFFVPKYDTAKQERKILHHLQWKSEEGPNDCVVKLIGSGSYAAKEFIVIEFVEGLCLDAVCFNGDFQKDMEYTRQIFLNLAIAMRSIHQRKVIHRDLKAENVIVCENSKVVKIIDFGCSLLAGDRPFPAGTSPYVAPEVWKSIRTHADDITVPEVGGKDIEKCDVFSFGILLWTCLTGKLPYQDQSLEDIKRQVMRGQMPKMNTSWPEDIVDVLQHCLMTNPAQRIGTTKLIELLEKAKL